MGVSFAKRAGRGNPPELGDKWALYGYRFEIAPNTKTFTADDIGKDVYNTGATAAVTYTLPNPPSGGGRMRFINTCAVGGITVATQLVDTMVALNDTTADSIACTSANASIGAVLECVSDGTSWICWVASVGTTETVNT